MASTQYALAHSLDNSRGLAMLMLMLLLVLLMLMLLTARRRNNNTCIAVVRIGGSIMRDQVQHSLQQRLPKRHTRLVRQNTNTNSSAHRSQENEMKIQQNIAASTASNKRIGKVRAWQQDTRQRMRTSGKKRELRLTRPPSRKMISPNESRENSAPA